MTIASFQIRTIAAVAVAATLGSAPAFALPGDRTETVLAWMNANPSLRPSRQGSLIVRRGETPSRRFHFQASPLAPGSLSVPSSPGRIRSEKFEIVDRVNGVPVERLEESLRAIYGIDIYNDYARAPVLYTYPSLETLDLARRQNLPALGAQQGELREGKRFAYWIEVTYASDGTPLNGRVTLFLKDDLEKVASELRDR